MIGERQSIETPFGQRPLVYADYTASGRSLASVESFIRQRVLPLYANTHSDSSLTGRQSNALREEARRMIRNATSATADDAVIFCGSGATAAINRLIDIMGLRLSTDPARAALLLEQIPEAQRPVVFVGPYEHHSNELPWRESLCTVVSIPLDDNGHLDRDALRDALIRMKDRPLRIGSFSAASNVTGIRTDTTAISRLLHDHDALTFWDYAAAAPYVRIDMTDKDAVFLSPHKFIGGPGTPGVLIVKRHLATHAVPAMPGGGTVSFVTPDKHDYLQDLERREEGGTPGIVEAIRAGLVFRVQQTVGTARIESLERQHLQHALEAWRSHPSIHLLGDPEAERLSIVSLQIRAGERQLHYGLVTVLLNDLFGIQARGGCSCAGPYGHTLLGLDGPVSQQLRTEVLRGNQILRPGWVRMNFNYFIDEETLEYLIEAILFIADHGARLQGLYRFDASAGTWRHRRSANAPLISLEDFEPGVASTGTAICDRPLRDFLTEARELLPSIPEAPDDDDGLALDTLAESARWFFRSPDQSDHST
ncbi:MAG: aminotransferase class V-fold PLP-dependent enzyme [Pseudohongiellaceae bacterium]